MSAAPEWTIHDRTKILEDRYVRTCSICCAPDFDKLSKWQNLRGFSHSKLDPHARLGCHINERIQAKQLDLSFEKLIQARLRDAECTRRGLLSQAALLDKALDSNREIGTQQEVMRLLWRESDV